MFVFEVGGGSKRWILGYGGKEGRRGACTCVGGPGMKGRSSGWRCAGDIDSLNTSKLDF
jgi:hypothetical protein